MKKLFQLLAGVFLLALPLAAQSVGPISVTGSNCATIGTFNQVATVGINVSGTWSTTLLTQGTIQGQSAFTVLVVPAASAVSQSNITANGAYTVSVAGLSTFQICGSSLTGTAVISLNASQGFDTFAAAGGSISSSGLVISSAGTTAPSPLATAEGPCAGMNPYIYGLTSAGTYIGLAAFDTTNYGALPASPYGNIVNCRGEWWDDIDAAPPIVGHSYFNAFVHGTFTRGIPSTASMFNVQPDSDVSSHAGIFVNTLYLEQDLKGAPTAMGSEIPALKVRGDTSWNVGAPVSIMPLTSIQVATENDYTHVGKTYVHTYLSGINGDVTNNLSGGTMPVYGEDILVHCGGNANDCASLNVGITGSSTGIKAGVIQADTSGAVYGIYQKGATDPNLFGTFGSRGLLTTYDGITTAGIGLEPVVGSSVLTAQTTSLGPTTLFTVGASSASFRIRASVYCTTATATATVALTINYTDPSNTAQSIAPSAAACTTLGVASFALINSPIDAKNATNITYSTTVANSPGGYRVSVQVLQDSTN